MINISLYVCIDVWEKMYINYILNKSLLNAKFAIETADLKSVFQRHYMLFFFCNFFQSNY